MVTSPNGANGSVVPVSLLQMSRHAATMDERAEQYERGAPHAFGARSTLPSPR